jgi:hypothetical protein
VWKLYITGALKGAVPPSLAGVFCVSADDGTVTLHARRIAP